MSLQMYIVTFKGAFTEETSRDVQRFVRECGGLILMATRNGPLVLLNPTKVAAVARHPDVEFVGGVTLDPSGLAADRLQRIFRENLREQLEIKDTNGKETAQ